jgi:hypothetical protein
LKWRTGHEKTGAGWLRFIGEVVIGDGGEHER